MASSAPWAVIVFLHGSDDLDKVKQNGPPKVAARDPDFPFVVAAPQCPAGTFREPVQVIALVDEVLERHRGDPARMYLTGLSMGGSGTWDTARQ